MIEGILAWQAIIFVSIALGGRKRGWIVGFWVVWTLLQVFALWLSVIQFGTIWLAWSIFGSKTSSAVEAPPPKLDPVVEAERLAKQKREDDEFKEAHRLWVSHLSGALRAGRWIPNGSAGRLLAKYPAPKHAHRVGTQDHNLLVVEAKRHTNRDFAKDIWKLRGMTGQAGRYAYAVGVHLVLNIPAGRVVRADVYIDGAINAEATQWFAGHFK